MSATTSPRLALAELYAPLPLFAVAVMAVNDNFLKVAFHNEITGKLSDFAVCIVLPLYLAAVLGLVLPQLGRRARLGIGAGITVALYSALELSPRAIEVFCAANAWVARLLGLEGRYGLTADVTDLLALPFVGLAYWYGVRRPG